MNWLSIIFWLITNAPKIWEAIQELIKWIESLNDGDKKELAKSSMIAALNQYATDKDAVKLNASLAAVRQIA